MINAYNVFDIVSFIVNEITILKDSNKKRDVLLSWKKNQCVAFKFIHLTNLVDFLPCLPCRRCYWPTPEELSNSETSCKLNRHHNEDRLWPNNRAGRLRPVIQDGRLRPSGNLACQRGTRFIPEPEAWPQSRLRRRNCPKPRNRPAPGQDSALPNVGKRRRARPTPPQPDVQNSSVCWKS